MILAVSLVEEVVKRVCVFCPKLQLQSRQSNWLSQQAKQKICILREAEQLLEYRIIMERASLQYDPGQNANDMAERNFKQCLQQKKRSSLTADEYASRECHSKARILLQDRGYAVFQLDQNHRLDWLCESRAYNISVVYTYLVRMHGCLSVCTFLSQLTMQLRSSACQLAIVGEMDRSRKQGASQLTVYILVCIKLAVQVALPQA